MQQGSEDWFAARRGKVTASKVSDVMAKGRSGQPSKTREAYMVKLALERITGKTQDTFKSQAMQDGSDNEANARAWYEMQNGVEVKEVGFIPHPTIEMAGASPDGLVGEKGMIEIKCPMPHTHFETLRTRNIPKAYFCQMQFQMAVERRDWTHYVSYCDQFPLHLIGCEIEVKADLEFRALMEDAILLFLQELDEMVKDIESIGVAA